MQIICKSKKEHKHLVQKELTMVKLIHGRIQAAVKNSEISLEVLLQKVSVITLSIKLKETNQRTLGIVYPHFKMGDGGKQEMCNGYYTLEEYNPMEVLTKPQIPFLKGGGLLPLRPCMELI